MRRFIASLAGKILSQVVVVSLLVPSLSLALVNRGEAQVQLLPSWAVTEFQVHNGLDNQFGLSAADAVSGELARTAKYQMITPGAVNNEIKSLGLTSPLQGQNNLLRVGQELGATTIVSGDVIGMQIKSTGGGKSAKIAMRVVAYDVASGYPINAAAVIGESTIRSGSDVTDELLIKDGIRAGANQAIRDFQQHQLPGATVLNTLTDRCYINQGTRAGFTSGQEVVITRGKEQVAAGHISDLEPDESSVIIERSYLGVAPGDHIRAIYPIPEVNLENPFQKGGNGLVVAKRSGGIGNNAGLISLLVVVGLIGALLGNGGNTENVIASLSAQASLDPPTGFTLPTVLVSWTGNAYAKGNSQLAAWQIWRSDFQNAPIQVTAGTTRSFFDDFVSGGNVSLLYASGSSAWSNFNGIIGGNGNPCNGLGSGGTKPATIPTIVPGTSYTYQVELVYGLSSNDLPQATSTTGSGSTAGITSGGTTASSTTAGGTTGSGTSTTGTSTTGTSTTGTSTTGTSTTGSTSTTSGTTATLCYFLSPRQATGVATPLNPPVLLTPGTTAIAQGAQTPFTFTGSARLQAQTLQYIIQFSSSQTFSNNVITYPANGGVITSFGSGGVSGSTTGPKTPLVLFGTTGILQSIQNGTVFWRVGVKNSIDVPGPQPDPYTKQRYIFCQPSFFTMSTQTPGTPASKVHRSKRPTANHTTN